MLIFLSLSSCTSLDIDEDKVTWVGDFENERITNALGETIDSSHPEFNNYVCTDFKTLIELKKYVNKLERKAKRRRK